MVLYIVLGITLVALITLLVIWFIKRKRAKAAEAAGDQAGPGGDEISILIREAETRLSAAKLEAGAKVGNLPVFLVLGEPGSTKTSIVLHSGLDPELLAGQVMVNNDVVPTRSANLWFSRRTLFVEAGGTLPADPSKWKKLVKRLQPRASVVGRGEQAPRAAIVCFDAENFTRSGAQEAAASSARTLRARLGEVSQSLGINLPVYVLFTRMDRLPFFLEYVRNLSEQEGGQVLGVTLPMLKGQSEGVYAEQETARLAGSFEALYRSLADARIEFLARETDESKLPPAYEFPREFRKIRPVLVQFLVDLCRPSQLTVGPFLRGFYFTGVRPVIVNEAAPVAAAAQGQAAHELGGATGIFGMSPAAHPAAQRQAPVVSTRKVPQWVFLTQLFSGVMLADSTALGASGASTRTSTGRRILFLAGASLALLLTVFLTVSFFKNRGLEKQVQTAAQAISAAPIAGGDLAPLDQLQKLENLRVALDRLGSYRRVGSPFTYHFGLYTGDTLYPEARRIYFARFRQLLLGQTQAADLQFLQTLPLKPGPDYNPTYEALKAYLITTTNPEKSTRAFLTPVLMRWWTNGRTADQARATLAQKQFDFYADELREGNPYGNAVDTGGVARGRVYLSQFAGIDRVYAFMLAEANKANPPINFHRQFPEASKVVLDPYEVPGAFSKGGWAFMKDAIAHADRYFAGEEWVLGKQNTGALDAAGLAQAIRARYYADFTNEWRKYIRAGSVVRYTGIPDAAQKLGITAGAQSPLLALMCLASENTAVDEPAVAGPFQPVQAVVPPGCLSRYTGPSNQNYMGSLLTLQASIEALAGQGQATPDNAAAAPTLANAQQAKVVTRQVAQTFRSDSDMGAPVQKLLEDPITWAEGVLRGVGPAILNAKGAAMCKQISPILNKYPFKPEAQAQATLQEVNLIYHPKEGVIWQLYDSSLSKIVTRQGEPIPGAAVTITPAFRGFLGRSAAFTDAAYAGAAADPKLTYSVKPALGTDTDRIKITIDGQSAEFSGTPAAKNFVWPGSPQGVQLTVRVKGGTEYIYPSYDGLWSVFQFVGDADKRVGTMMEMTLRAGKTGRPVLNQANNQPVSVRLDMVATPPVFDKGYFSTLNCVPEVAKQ
jgi:type VI secretion system protein ImpL